MLCKSNGNFHSNRLERRRKWCNSEGCPFVPENVQRIGAHHLHSNRLYRKFRLNGKRPGFSKVLTCWYLADKGFREPTSHFNPCLAISWLPASSLIDPAIELSRQFHFDILHFRNCLVDIYRTNCKRKIKDQAQGKTLLNS